MINFNKVDTMIDYIEKGIVPEDKTFNEFAKEFYLETKTLTLSKYIRLKGFNSKVPKIMNTKKAGEVIYETELNADVKSFLSRKGYKIIPELNYSAIMLLRKIELIDNWQKLIYFFEGGRSVQEINSSLKKELLPIEREKLETFIKEELSITDQELNWLINKTNKVQEDPQLKKALKKLLK